MASIKTRQRYLLLSAREQDSVGNDAVALALRGNHKSEGGTDLPAKFPKAAKAKLREAGYVFVEDLDGADVEELIDLGLTSDEAQGALKALGFGS